MTGKETNWTKQSWQQKPIQQQPTYEDEAALGSVLGQLAALPPLVTPREIRLLKTQLAEVALGKAFLLQGGDCAESFAEFNEENLRRYFQVLLQMNMVLMFGAGMPVVKLGRIAGQFAKPRSADTETVDGVTLPSYRGDIINEVEFSEAARRNDPEHLKHAYYQSGATLNFLRALAKSEDANLRNVSSLNNHFVQTSPQGKRFADMTARITRSLQFMEACRVNAEEMKQLQEADFFVSHEGLLLPYEEAFVRYDEATDAHYACSAHLLWIGERTRALDEAHIEFFRGIANPIACKVGPSMDRETLLGLIDALNPENEPGRLTLITRMGANIIGEKLPALVRAVKEEGRHVVWSSDPMHGNTVKSPSGLKTRPFNDILAEVRQFFAVHKAEGTHAGGVHIEMTGQDVTECTGGAQAISEVELKNRYHTHCDPRLNGSQSLELAFLLSEALQER